MVFCSVYGTVHSVMYRKLEFLLADTSRILSLLFYLLLDFHSECIPGNPCEIEWQCEVIEHRKGLELNVYFPYTILVLNIISQLEYALILPSTPESSKKYCAWLVHIMLDTCVLCALLQLNHSYIALSSSIYAESFITFFFANYFWNLNY